MVDGLFVKAILIIGLVAFAREFPKLIGEVTGIKSGNLKVRDFRKGLTGAASLGYSGINTLAKKTLQEGNKFKDSKEKSFGSAAKAVGRVFGSTGAAMYNTARNGGLKAKNYKEAKSAAEKGYKVTNDNAARREMKRNRYKTTDDNWKSDLAISFKEWAGLEADFDKLEADNKILTSSLEGHEKVKGSVEKVLERDQYVNSVRFGTIGGLKQRDAAGNVIMTTNENGEKEEAGYSISMAQTLVKQYEEAGYNGSVETYTDDNGVERDRVKMTNFATGQTEYAHSQEEFLQKLIDSKTAINTAQRKLTKSINADMMDLSQDDFEKKYKKEIEDDSKLLDVYKDNQVRKNEMLNKYISNQDYYSDNIGEIKVKRNIDGQVKEFTYSFKDALNSDNVKFSELRDFIEKPSEDKVRSNNELINKKKEFDMQRKAEKKEGQ